MNILKIVQLTNEKWLNLFAATFEHNGHPGRWLYASRKPQPNTRPGRGSRYHRADSARGP